MIVQYWLKLLPYTQRKFKKEKEFFSLVLTHEGVYCVFKFILEKKVINDEYNKDYIGVVII